MYNIKLPREPTKIGKSSFPFRTAQLYQKVKDTTYLSSNKSMYN